MSAYSSEDRNRIIKASSYWGHMLCVWWLKTNRYQEVAASAESEAECFTLRVWATSTWLSYTSTLAMRFCPSLTAGDPPSRVSGATGTVSKGWVQRVPSQTWHRGPHAQLTVTLMHMATVCGDTTVWMDTFIRHRKYINISQFPKCITIPYRKVMSSWFVLQLKQLNCLVPSSFDLCPEVRQMGITFPVSTQPLSQSDSRVSSSGHYHPNDNIVPSATCLIATFNKS